MKRLLGVLLLLAGPAGAQEIAGVMPTNLPMRFGAPVTVAADFGVVALGAKSVTIAVPGVRAGDAVLAGLAPGSSLAAGVVLGLPDATANGQVRLTMVTPLVAGVTVGTINIRLVWFGP